MERLLLLEMKAIRTYNMLSNDEIQELYNIFYSNKTLSRAILSTLRLTRIKMQIFENKIEMLLKECPSWEFDRKNNILYIRQLIPDKTMSDLMIICTNQGVKLQLPLL